MRLSGLSSLLQLFLAETERASLRRSEGASQADSEAFLRSLSITAGEPRWSASSTSPQTLRRTLRCKPKHPIQDPRSCGVSVFSMFRMKTLMRRWSTWASGAGSPSPETRLFLLERRTTPRLRICCSGARTARWRRNTLPEQRKLSRKKLSVSERQLKLCF